MSFSEFIVVALVAFLLLSPKDLKSLFKFLHSLQQQFRGIRQQVFKHIDEQISQTNLIDVKDEIEKINYYITQIHELGSVYNGEYNLEEVQEYYKKLVAKKESHNS